MSCFVIELLKSGLTRQRQKLSPILAPLIPSTPQIRPSYWQVCRRDTRNTLVKHALGTFRELAPGVLLNPTAE